MELHNIDLEKSILSTLMTLEDSYLEISHLVKTDDFYAGRHQTIFEAIIELNNQNEPYDALMVADVLEVDGTLDDVGGQDYLGEILQNSTVSKFNLKSYAKRIRELAALRQTKQILSDAQATIDAKGDYADKVNDIVEKLTAVVDEKTVMKGAETISEMMDGFFMKLQEYAHAGQTPFVKTGFVEIDNRVNLQAGELVVLAGRPAMGKSTLAQNILQNIVRQTNGVGVFFSLEMAKDVVMQRFMASEAGVELFKVKSGQGFNEHDFSKLSNIVNRYGKGYNLYVDDRTALTISQMRSTLNKIRQKQGKISVIMVDYIQIMGGIGDNTARGLGDIAMALKNFSKEYNCPVIALSQLNRDNEKRPNSRPKMADLKDSSGIEQAADHIWAVHRPEVYDDTDKKLKGKAELLVLKQRQGAIGTVHLGFEGHYVRFTDCIPFLEDEIPNQFTGGDHA